MSNSLAGLIDQRIREVVLPLEEGGCDIINPNAVANAVLSLIDPDKNAPDLVAYCTTMDLRQRCRKFLQHRHDPVEKALDYATGANDDLFGGLLQDYYPARREGEEESVYVRRDQMTVVELSFASKRMRKAGEGLVQHADALDAYAASRHVA